MALPHQLKTVPTLTGWDAKEGRNLTSNTSLKKLKTERSACSLGPAHLVDLLLGQGIEHAEAVIVICSLVSIDLPGEGQRNLQLLIHVIRGCPMRQVPCGFHSHFQQHSMHPTTERGTSLPRWEEDPDTPTNFCGHGSTFVQMHFVYCMAHRQAGQFKGMLTEYITASLDIFPM